MLACTIPGTGDLDKIQIAQVAEPQARPGEVRVSMRAGALNHLDLFVIQGLPGTLRFPHILGADGAGVVDAVGSGVTAVKPGDRVMINPGVWDGTCAYCRDGEHSLCLKYQLLGEHLPGTFAQQVVVPERNLALIPAIDPPLTWAEAAAFSLVTLTAWRMLVTRAALQPGETILIWGIGGGVSLAALAIAKLRGARTIVTSSSDAKLAAALRYGADVTLNHRTQQIVQEVRGATSKRGADVVVDTIGAATWEQSLRALSRKGRLVTCGATSGPQVVTDLRRVFWNQQTIMGSTMGNAAEYREVTRQLALGRLRPTIDQVYPLAEARAAFERLEQGAQLGKVALEIPAATRP
jgi:NADPH:quinone reductase-like Zn-dependent oxidoreductase